MKKKLLLGGVLALVLLIVVVVGVSFVWHEKNFDEVLRDRVPETADTLLFVNGHFAVRTDVYGKVQKKIREELKRKHLPENLLDCRVLAFANVKEQWGGAVAQFQDGQAGAFFEILLKECKKDSSLVKSSTSDGLPLIKVKGSGYDPDVAMILCNKNLLLVAVGKTDPAMFRPAAPNPLIKHIRQDNMILSAVSCVNFPVGGKVKEKVDMVLRFVPSLQNLETLFANVPFSPNAPVLDFRAVFKEAHFAWEALGALNVGIGIMTLEIPELETQLRRGVDQKTLFAVLKLEKILEKILER